LVAGEIVAGDDAFHEVDVQRWRETHSSPKAGLEWGTSTVFCF
jgi:hypothetical protein